MGLLGSILYPDNPELAKDLNQKYQKLLDNNELHNNLTNSYNALAKPISQFDAHLMALLCMQYAIVYDEEKLADLPDSPIPKIAESIGDRIESYVGLGVGAGVTLKSLYAMGKGSVNLYRNAGIYKAQIRSGYGSFKASMQNGLDRVHLRITQMRSGNVSALAEAEGVELRELAAEGAGVEGAEALGPEEAAAADAEVVDVAVAEEAAAVAEGAEVAEVSIAAAEAGGTLLGAASAILGPATLVLLGITEIIGAVEAGEQNAKLKEAETNMDQLLADQQSSISFLRKAFSNLLTCAIQDIQEYNQLIQHELELSPSKKNFFTVFQGFRLKGGFSSRDLESYRDNLPHAVDLSSITTFEKNANSGLGDAFDCIRAQAIQDETDTKIVLNIKQWLKKHNQSDITADYIREAIDIFGVDKTKVDYCNQLRKFMNEFAQVMLPYHQAINQLPQTPGARVNQPAKDPMDHNAQPSPNYNADPNDFSLAWLSNSTPSTDIASVTLSNRYVWLEQEYDLPLEFNCNFICHAETDEFLPCFSQTKAQWASPDCDALNWYMSPHRHDFTFRTKLFREFPAVKRHVPGFNLQVGKQYQMKCQIKNNTATYWIDNQKYATATYAPGAVPARGYIGFAVYGPENISVKDIAITSL
jgi:hypothetical protein